ELARELRHEPADVGRVGLEVLDGELARDLRAEGLELGVLAPEVLRGARPGDGRNRRIFGHRDCSLPPSIRNEEGNGSTRSDDYRRLHEAHGTSIVPTLPGSSTARRRSPGPSFPTTCTAFTPRAMAANDSSSLGIIPLVTTPDDTSALPSVTEMR